MSQKVDVFILSFCLFINKASRKIIFVILQVWAHISKQNANCKLILFISLHSNNEHFISHIYQIIWCFHLRFLLFYNKASKEANDHMSKKGMMLAFNATLLLSLAFISIRWADLSILAIGEVLIRNRKKHPILIKWELTSCFLLSALPNQGNISWLRQTRKMVNQRMDQCPMITLVSFFSTEPVVYLFPSDATTVK